MDLQAILEGVREAIDELGLQIGGTDLAVSVRSAPTVEEGIDALPLAVVAGEALSWTPWDSEGALRVEYSVAVGVVAAWNRDASPTTESDEALARIALALSGPAFADAIGALMVRAMSPEEASRVGWAANLRASPLRLAVSMIGQAGT